MNTFLPRKSTLCLASSLTILLALFVGAPPLPAQTLVNVSFGVGSRSLKTGFAATGQSTNDFWNLYRHYDPKFLPGTPLVSDGLLKDLKLSDGTDSKISVAVKNAPGVWGNSTGDSMYDTYIFAQNGSNITVIIQNLEPGRYHFYLYGHADPDVTGEQNSAFTLRSGTNTLGPLMTLGASAWKATSPWQERYQYVVFRDVPVQAGTPVMLDVAPGPNGVAVLNGLQISSRGTSPPRLLSPALVKAPFAFTNLIFHQVRYDGKVTDNEARFKVTLQVESMTTNEIAAPLFEGDVAVLVPQLPEGLRIASSAKQYRLVATAPGAYTLNLELVAKITRAEPWNQISFLGPNAAIASVAAQAAAAGVEMQLLSGTQIDPDQKASSKLQGFLGIDRTLSMRWQSKGAEVARKSLVTVDTVATAQITPTVIKFTTQFRYEILQATVPRLIIALPASHALTKLQGDQIRDWNVKKDGDRQLLSVEFIKPLEKGYNLTLFSEQTVEGTPQAAQLAPPQPLEIEREAGSFAISADDMLVDIDSALGLRQVNAGPGALAAYRFYGRPFTLSARLKRVEPVLKVADRVTARLEEARLLISHALTLNVEKAGIYALELVPQTNLVVSEVRGDGVEDWKVTDGKLRVSFASRVLDSRRINVQLEQALKTFPDQIVVGPLRVTAATNETAQIGAASALGIQLKTAGDLAGLREIPISALAARSDELLAFNSDQTDWKLTLAAERLPARVVADVFNLVTIGDGLVGGSAMIRYGLINQGVQEFRVKLPAQWKNVEFTGPNIRRKETAPAAPADTNFVVWTIALQDKAWGGYTLVITYDYQFDPKKASLDLGGAHALNIERETGSVAITTAASIKVEARAVIDPLRVIDPTELAETDRALITRPVLLAYRYSGESFQLAVDVVRHEEVKVLDAVADRTQLTSVLTEAGEMLTQASFMVKNNDRQFQKFRLPAAAKLWGCTVNNQPVKAELDGEWLAVSLPRGANRDAAFAVDIVYEQNFSSLKSRAFPKSIDLAAPRTDVPNTYAEWELYAPPTQRLSGFGGNMTVLRGTTYGLRDAWNSFVEFYSNLIQESGGTILALGGFAVLLIALIGGGMRRGWGGIGAVLGVTCILLLLAGMLLPALSRAKAKASRISAISNLKQIGLAARMFAGDNGGRMPASFDEMKNELGSDKILVDPESGQPFVYVGAGKKEGNSQGILAYSPVEAGGMRTVAMMDGSARWMTTSEFSQALQRDALAGSQAEDAGLQANAVLQQQIRTADGSVTAPTQPAPSRPMQAPAANAALATLPALAIDPATGLPMRPTQPLLGAGGIGGAGFGGGGAVAAASPASSADATPTAAGIRSLRFNIPRTGQPFMFTKVLNAISDEPLSVKVSTMSLKWFKTWRSLLQLSAFLVGLIMVWQQWFSREPSSFRMAIGFALSGGSVVSLLIAARVLHLALIIALPLLVLFLVGCLAWKLWPRRGGKSSSLPASPAIGPEPTGPSPVPPAVATIALLCFLGLPHQARAQDLQDSAFRVPNSEFPTNAFTITSGSYTGSVREKVAQFDVSLIVATFATNQVVSLFGDDVAIEDFSTKAKEARLVRQGSKVALRLGEKGNTTVQLKLLVKLGGDVTKRQLAFTMPPALSSKLTVTLAESEADVEFPTAVAFKRVADKEETRVEAVLGSGDRVEMSWTPRVKRVAEMAASIVVQNTALVTFGAGAINTRATLDYQITQGELRQLKVRLPAGQRLLRVEGESLRTWELNDAGQVLTVDLIKGVSPAYRLTVETEKLLDTLPAQAAVEIPSAQDVIREAGLIAMRGGEELSLSVEGAPDLQRVDAAEFAKTSTIKADGVLSAYRFLKPGFQLLLRAEAVRSQIEATVRNSIRVGFEQVSVSAQIDYIIKKAGIFSLRLALPPGYKVESVTGAQVAQWSEKTEPRTLEVTLKERTLGPSSLRIELVKQHKELPKTIEVVGVGPLEVQKLTGFISVSGEPGVSIKAGAFDGLVEIPAASLGDNGKPSGANTGVLAYKFIAADPANAAWKLSVGTEAVDSWVRAEIVNIVSVSETLVSGRALVRYDIMNAPVKEFRLRVPAAYKNVEINGPNIRRRDRTNDEWRVELQNKVRGDYTLAITWEQPRNARTNSAVEVLGVEAPGVERETGSVVIVTRPPLQVVEKFAADQMVKIDARELPAWAGVSTGTAAAGAEVPVLVYRYLRPGYTLTLEARRFEEAALLQALVDSAHFTTVVADDGQMMTEMTLAIRNNGLQHLESELPADARVWSAFVAGQPVRPSRRGAKLLLPLERSGADEAPVSVELTYVGSEKFPRRRGEVNLASPKLGAPLKNARWDLYLPPEFTYTKFEGSMAHDAEAAPVVQVYSAREYDEQEQQKRTVRKSEARSFLSNARSQLATGKIKGVNEEYNRLNGNVDFDSDVTARKELESLKKDLGKVQSSNLIQAQRAYTFENNKQYGAQEQAPAFGGFGGGGGGGVGGASAGQAAQVADLVQYDTDVAERQWEVLQKAQEVSTAKVQPLRVNLPTRGQRHSFSQVLQTEVNKPMTIQFSAASTRDIGWPRRILYGAGLFLMLWLFASTLANRSSRQDATQPAG